MFRKTFEIFDVAPMRGLYGVFHGGADGRIT
jgi:hypothetical protein